MHTPKPTTVLFLAGDPYHDYTIRLGHELDQIIKRVKKTGRGFCFQQKMAADSNQLQEYLMETQPDLLHFVGHGLEDGSLKLENQTGPAALHPDELAHLIKTYNHRPNPIRCIFLNACNTHHSIKKLADHVSVCIAYEGSIGDTAAIKFTEGFYNGLTNHYSLGDAIEFGKARMGKTQAALLRCQAKAGGLDLVLYPAETLPQRVSRIRDLLLAHPIASLVGLFLLMLGLTAILVGMGSMIHTSRQNMLGLPDLDYPLLVLLATGLRALLLDLVPALLSALLSPGHGGLAFTVRGLVVLCGLFLVLRRVRPLRQWAVVWCFALTLPLFWAALNLAYVAVYAQNQQNLDQPADILAARPLDARLANRIAFECHSWLVNDTSLNQRRREAIYGMTLWFLLAALCAAGCLGHIRAVRKGIIRLLQTAWLLSLFFILLMLPQAYVTAHWGLMYPKLHIETGCLPNPPPQPGLCTGYDLSAGGQPQYLWLGGDCPTPGLQNRDQLKCPDAVTSLPGKGLIER